MPDKRSEVVLNRRSFEMRYFDEQREVVVTRPCGSLEPADE